MFSPVIPSSSRRSRSLGWVYDVTTGARAEKSKNNDRQRCLGCILCSCLAHQTSFLFIYRQYFSTNMGTKLLLFCNTYFLFGSIPFLRWSRCVPWTFAVKDAWSFGTTTIHVYFMCFNSFAPKTTRLRIVEKNNSQKTKSQTGKPHFFCVDRANHGFSFVSFVGLCFSPRRERFAFFSRSFRNVFSTPWALGWKPSSRLRTSWMRMPCQGAR